MSRKTYVQFAPVVLTTAAFVWTTVVSWWIWTRPIRSVGLASSQDDPAKMIPDERIYSFSDISALGPLPLLVPIALTGVAALAARAQRAVDRVCTRRCAVGIQLHHGLFDRERLSACWNFPIGGRRCRI